MAANLQDEIRTRRLTVEREDGSVAISLGTDPTGLAQCLFKDQSGNDRISVFLDPDETPGIQILDIRGQPRVELSVGPAGSLISLRDLGGKLRLAVIVDPEGIPAVLVMDEHESRRAALMLRKDRHPSLVFFDRRGEVSNQIFD